jgi:large subunit ribosomal protein L11
MAKKITGLVRLQLPAGRAEDGPPVGRGLGRLGVNVPAFCREFNAATAHAIGTPIAVIVTVYEDQSFSFTTTSPAGRTPATAT